MIVSQWRYWSWCHWARSILRLWHARVPIKPSTTLHPLILALVSRSQFECPSSALVTAKRQSSGSRREGENGNFGMPKSARSSTASVRSAFRLGRTHARSQVGRPHGFSKRNNWACVENQRKTGFLLLGNRLLAPKDPKCAREVQCHTVHFVWLAGLKMVHRWVSLEIRFDKLFDFLTCLPTFKWVAYVVF